MDNARLRSELERLRQRLGPPLCAERHCARIDCTELILHPDGSQVSISEKPPELCAECPERSARSSIRHIEVVLDRRGRSLRDESDYAVASAARIASKGRGDEDTSDARSAKTL